MAQIEHMLLEIVDDAPGRADQDIDAFLEHAPLFLVIHAAEHDRELEPRVFRDALGIGVDLHRELPGRRDDDGAGSVYRPIRRAGIGQQPVEERDQKRRGLPGAGLRLAGHVLALEGERQGLRLDRRAAGEAEFGDTPFQ